MDDYSMFQTKDAEAIQVALDLIEEEHNDYDLHNWIPSQDKGGWTSKHCLFYLVFKGDEFKGFCALLNSTDGLVIHFGTIRSLYSIKTVQWAFKRIKDTTRNVYGIHELICHVDVGAPRERFISSLGFERLDEDLMHICY